jgi:pimeloyl-ACP methyl ester carboxylesterase
MRRLRVGDKLVRVRDEGEGKRAPLVCVHGAGASSVVWMDTVRRLAPRRRVVAPDLPAHGQSDPWHEQSIALYRDAIGTVCARLGIERAILVGHSMGGLVALACAAAWPERVAGLVVVGASARMAVAPRVFEVLERDYARAPAFFARVSWSPSTAPELIARWAGLMLTAEQPVTVGDFRAVDGHEAQPERVRCPTLILGGADDLLVPPASVQALATAIRSARAVVVPQAGHMIMLEQPERYFAELDQFLVTI